MFKQSFKHYKAKGHTPDFTNVVDFDKSPHLLIRDSAEATALPLQNPVCRGLGPTLQIPLGVKHPDSWQCYQLGSHPGLLIVRNPFTPQGQRYWIARSLRDYPRAPNMVNLQAHDFIKAVKDDWWTAMSQNSDKHEKRKLKAAMRWATLGYHHNWDTKQYAEALQSPFPVDLSELCGYFAEILGYGKFKSQAAIVNYYPIGTALSGHTDHSEVNFQAPLFSFSFGQTAIFLIGGRTLEEKPSALYLRSGDVLIMSKESRLCYHAVPRVMKAETEPWNDYILDSVQLEEHVVKCGPNKISEEKLINFDLYLQTNNEHFWLPFRRYINESRININVRQVLNPGQSHLPF